MTPGLTRDRFAPLLDSLRWLLVFVPLASIVPKLDGTTWPLAAVALVSSVPLLWLPSRPSWLLPISLIVLAGAGGALWVYEPNGPAVVIVYTALFYAARLLSLPAASAAGAVTLTATSFLISYYRLGLRNALLDLALIAVAVLLGLNRRARRARLEQTELALARARTAAEEHAVAARLAERARIARELHDVLAHSLSGLALNLQSARLMLVRDGASPETLAQIERAQQLAAEGLAEARNAVATLRDDLVPLESAVADLVTAYRLDTGAAADLTVHGEPRPVATAASTAVVRAVQEALANTRKHATGAPVTVELAFTPDEVTVTVLDRQGRRPRPGGPAGYGLRGMRERAELLGGRLTTGPGEDGWQVRLTVPA
ncbi:MULTISPECIES: sensor histidine kinase [Amycolatopsis]|uniref:histidine kinase n=2 Tax=Amycolatopsis TaxID=1813 RepID=A0A1I3Z040_9PSEU|nr:sensor histidine kinase [Amycolatopsis sacchari]SFK37472.1 Signal transduction histidine kinase [Amycolatopsis sacchari]